MCRILTLAAGTAAPELSVIRPVKLEPLPCPNATVAAPNRSDNKTSQHNALGRAAQRRECFDMCRKLASANYKGMKFIIRLHAKIRQVRFRTIPAGWFDLMVRPERFELPTFWLAGNPE